MKRKSKLHKRIRQMHLPPAALRQASPWPPGFHKSMYPTSSEPSGGRALTC